MEDLRKYKEDIFDAVKTERELDDNWQWRVEAINKKEARIAWGYLDYIGEEEPFKIILFDEDGDVSIMGKFPVGETKAFSWIGDKHWHDARTVNMGIRQTIHALANAAHNEY